MRAVLLHPCTSIANAWIVVLASGEWYTYEGHRLTKRTVRRRFSDEHPGEANAILAIRAFRWDRRAGGRRARVPPGQA